MGDALYASRFVGLRDGRLAGRPPQHAIVNVLAGLATCGECGGSLVVETSSRKGTRVAEYVCHTRRHKGTCSNSLRAPAEDMHDAVLAWLEEHIFTPEALEHVIRFTETTSQQAADDRKALECEHRDLKQRIANLLIAIETGGEAAALVKQVQTYESRQSAIAHELAALRPVPRLAPTVAQDRLNEWRRLLRGSTTQARAVIQRVVDGRITFNPREDGQGYDFTGRTRFDRVFTGFLIQVPAWMMQDSSLNAVFDPNDTLDADYGALLSKFYGKCMASPTAPDHEWMAKFEGFSRARAA